MKRMMIICAAFAMAAPALAADQVDTRALSRADIDAVDIGGSGPLLIIADQSDMCSRGRVSDAYFARVERATRRLAYRARKAGRDVRIAWVRRDTPVSPRAAGYPAIPAPYPIFHGC
ncbi:MAG: hypothetical protein DI537_34675 [Stutzerimonas stutzeri]|nr:MAG: hypothetical protein DI537_34675 [Stutzerimonas stutzeri]